MRRKGEEASKFQILGVTFAIIVVIAVVAWGVNDYQEYNKLSDIDKVLDPEPNELIIIPDLDGEVYLTRKVMTNEYTYIIGNITKVELDDYYVGDGFVTFADGDRYKFSVTGSGHGNVYFSWLESF